MQATEFEFRFRRIILIATVAVPILLARFLSMPSTDHVLADDLGISQAAAYRLVWGLALALGLLGAGLRYWGTLHVTPAVVRDKSLRADKLVMAGPYRYTRNPIYAGLWITLVALAVPFGWAAALSTAVLLSLVLIRLANAEEAALRNSHPDEFGFYSARVPQFVPRLRRPLLPSAPRQATWIDALRNEALILSLLLGELLALVTGDSVVIYPSVALGMVGRWALIRGERP